MPLGYRKIITTPHVMSDYYQNTPEVILAGLEKVKQAVADIGLDIELRSSSRIFVWMKVYLKKLRIKMC